MLGEIVFGAKKAKPSICKKAFTFCTREMFAAGLGMGAQKHHASFFQIEMRLILCMLFFLSVFFSERVCLNLCAFCYQTISSTTKNFFHSVSKQIRSQYTQSEKKTLHFLARFGWLERENSIAMLFCTSYCKYQLSWCAKKGQEWILRSHWKTVNGDANVIPVSQPPVHGLAPSKGLLEEDFSTQIVRNNVYMWRFFRGLSWLPPPKYFGR